MNYLIILAWLVWITLWVRSLLLWMSPNISTKIPAYEIPFWLFSFDGGGGIIILKEERGWNATFFWRERLVPNIFSSKLIQSDIHSNQITYPIIFSFLLEWQISVTAIFVEAEVSLCWFLLPTYYLYIYSIVLKYNFLNVSLRGFIQFVGSSFKPITFQLKGRQMLF